MHTVHDDGRRDYPMAHATLRLEAEDQARSEYLAARCQLKSWRDKHGIERAPRLCAVCGEEIPKGLAPKAVYCSRKCRRIAERKGA
jgi:hypothetical protein